MVVKVEKLQFSLGRQIENDEFRDRIEQAVAASSRR
jgi:hypothetical protein